MTLRCGMCGGPGIRKLGARGYCGAHLTELYRRFDPAVFTFHGTGLQDGPLRPDYGPQYADLRCCSCGATWTGVVGDPCWWCRRAHEILLEHSADVAMEPPDVDPADRNYLAQMTAWGQRLRRAVDAGVVDERRARRVWEGVRRDAA